MLRIRAALLAVALVVPVAQPPAAHASAPAQKQAYFNNPPGGRWEPGEPTTSALTTRIVELIDAAAANAKIRIGMYFIGDAEVSDLLETEPSKIIDALDRARQRNVEIRVIVDDRYTGSDGHVQRIENLDGGGAGGLVDVEFCTRGCYTSQSDDDSAKMHSKFMTIDNTTWTTGTERVVAVSSANWSDKQLRDHYYNDLVVVWNDSTLYQAFADYWSELWWCAAGHEGECNTQGEPTVQSRGGSTGTAVHFYPQASGDPQLTEITNVDCTAGNGLIRVAMGSWSGTFTRGSTIAGALDAQRERGCSIQILVPQDEAIIPTLASAGLNHRCLADGNLDDGDAGGPGVHVKQILISGLYSGVWSDIVFTGSTNLTNNALDDNDEVWFKSAYQSGAPTINLALFMAYEEQWGRMWAKSFPC